MVFPPPVSARKAPWPDHAGSVTSTLIQAPEMDRLSRLQKFYGQAGPPLRRTGVPGSYGPLKALTEPLITVRLPLITVASPPSDFAGPAKMFTVASLTGILTVASLKLSNVYRMPLAAPIEPETWLPSPDNWSAWTKLPVSNTRLQSVCPHPVKGGCRWSQSRRCRGTLRNGCCRYPRSQGGSCRCRRLLRPGMPSRMRILNRWPAKTTFGSSAGSRFGRGKSSGGRMMGAGIRHRDHLMTTRRFFFICSSLIGFLILSSLLPTPAAFMCTIARGELPPGNLPSISRSCFSAFLARSSLTCCSFAGRFATGSLSARSAWPRCRPPVTAFRSS
jgi:hypothetical protein